MKLLLQSLRSICLRIENRLGAQITKLQTALAQTRETAYAALRKANGAQRTANNAQGTADSAQSAASAKMNKTNPVGTGSFSMNRRAGSKVGAYSHAEGYNNIASGLRSHAEGHQVNASGNYSHAEGYESQAAGDYSHAEGYYTLAFDAYSHAEGRNVLVSGLHSHGEGYQTSAARRSQHVQGEYNIADTAGDSTTRGTYAHIVGNGSSGSARSNAHTLDWDGNAWFAGDVYVGSTSGTNRDDGSKKLATEEKVAEMVAADNTLPDFELLGTLDASTGDTQELLFDAPMREIFIESVITDSAGELYSASATNGKRTMYLYTDGGGDTFAWKHIPLNYGLCSHSWRYKYRTSVRCGPLVSMGYRTGTLSGDSDAATCFPVYRKSADMYYNGYVSGVRVVLTLNEGVENEATGSIAVYGIRA